MPSLTKIKQVTEIALQDFPEIQARYLAGDPTVTAPIQVMQHMLAELGRDVDVSELEPFIKSRESTILADASNKGILPKGTATQHRVSIKNNGTERVTMQSGRVFEDGQGRVWRFIQNAEIPAGDEIRVLAEQSQERIVVKTITETLPFFSFQLPITEDMALCSLSVKDNEGDLYSFVTRWMNAQAGEKAITLKTDTLRSLTLEFGDSERTGHTLQANTELSITIVETDGELDAANLSDAMLVETYTAKEGKLRIKFEAGGLVRMGANPLSIDQMRLLASYPTHDDNAVFLGNFEFLVRKNFMSRSYFLNVWNESIHETHYGASVANINHLFVSITPKNSGEYALICGEVANLIAQADSLYGNSNIVFKPAEERKFRIKVNAVLSPVHDVDAVKEQIKSLLLSHYGKEQIAASYYLQNGFNLLEISQLLQRDVLAFQDRQSNLSIETEDLQENPVKPHHWLYMDASTIEIDIQRSSLSGGSRWTVL
ncbi:hypothetical protein [Acinetobacter sp. ANC 3813]|uniref:hypothetical protein n=1 Tax=Acinetobacter sp. ANC 3813 TaxID=1977873 RepID=UPI000A345E10|nr:hypothetical protein [Acinetobacter sp. ANC 3813]OTG87880.1 hypothetical protein B9T34_16220 [Acinetobacter sp. ANC 3813]